MSLQKQSNPKKFSKTFLMLTCQRQNSAEFSALSSSFLIFLDSNKKLKNFELSKNKFHRVRDFCVGRSENKNNFGERRISSHEFDDKDWYNN